MRRNAAAQSRSARFSRRSFRILPKYRGGRADLDYPERSLLTTVETMRAHGLPLRGLIEASTDDWDRYHSLHWQAGLDWTLENPGHPDVAKLTDPAGMRLDLLDRRYCGWAIFVARNGLD